MTPKRSALTKNRLLRLGWADRGDVLVRYSNPRIGWKPVDGTLIIGYREYPKKVFSVQQIIKAIEQTTRQNSNADKH